MNFQPASPVPVLTGSLTVHLDRIVANYRTLARRAPGATCAAVVKADAYGLGAAPVARALHAAGCNDFFVAVLAEGIALRDALGARPRIIVLNGLPAGGETACANAGLTPVLNSMEQCRAWARMSRRPAVLQVDTGMSRLGLSVSEQEQLLASDLMDDLNLVLLMSHLANADEPNHPANAQQHASFLQACLRFPHLPSSLANTAGMVLSPAFHFALARPGAGLYGLETSPNARDLASVVTLTSPIAQLRDITAGTSVGYGYQFTASSNMRLAVVPVGYADGWPRSLSNIGAVWHCDVRLPIVGRVSMDSFMVDATGLDSLRVGDRVELLGPHQSPDDVARQAGTIGYEILTSLGRRYERHYVGEGEQ
jgi:alanine racemase